MTPVTPTQFAAKLGIYFFIIICVVLVIITLYLKFNHDKEQKKKQS